MIDALWFAAVLFRPTLTSRKYIILVLVYLMSLSFVAQASEGIHIWVWMLVFVCSLEFLSRKPDNYRLGWLIHGLGLLIVLMVSPSVMVSVWYVLLFMAGLFLHAEAKELLKYYVTIRDQAGDVEVCYAANHRLRKSTQFNINTARNTIEYTLDHLSDNDLIEAPQMFRLICIILGTLTWVTVTVSVLRAVILMSVYTVALYQTTVLYVLIIVSAAIIVMTLGTYYVSRSFFAPDRSRNRIVCTTHGASI